MHTSEMLTPNPVRNRFAMLGECNAALIALCTLFLTARKRRVMALSPSTPL